PSPADAASPATSAYALVDRFLSGKQPVGGASTAPQPAAGAQPRQPEVAGTGSPLPLPEPATVGQPSQLPSVAPAPAAPAPRAEVAAFVCEADVRLAIKDGRKIRVGPKTILTPAARDLASEHGLLTE
ncbi:MAG: hypothetical protein ACRD2E_10525, partial [Terriglobales bacterium]